MSKEKVARVGEPAQPDAERATASESVPNPNLRHWRAMARPPVTALKTIKGGRLQGMTDVNPQWRYQAMTEEFGPVGIGWAYTIDKLWTEPGADGEVLGFAQVSVKVRRLIGPNGSWASFNESQPIVGIGGNHLIVKEKNGLRSNDECWKMAVTDALSVALKMLGVAADIYAGRWDGTKFNDEPQEQEADGYREWLTDLELVADDGTQKLLATIKDSSEDYRTKLRADLRAWNALKARAEKADKAAA